jgi:hypothetical protein
MRGWERRWSSKNGAPPGMGASWRNIAIALATRESARHGADCRQPLPYRIMEGLPVILPQWATANRESQGALTQSRTTIARDPFYREWLCGAGQGCRGRILERLYIDSCLPLTVELFCQLAFFILSCKAHIVLPLQAYRCLYPLEL